ncbi:MAG: DMT family transporter [Bacillota bacterium]|nr:DMT family transporter [Bacillota bacterium]
MEKSRKTRILSGISLTFATVLWGLNYVAQQEGSKHLDPFTFNMLRMWIAAVFILPIILYLNHKDFKKLSFWTEDDNIKETVLGGIITGLVLISGLTCQQTGIRYTSVGKAGFLSSLSIIFVPLISILEGKKVRLYQWLGIFFSLLGAAILSFNDFNGINIGDLFMIATAFFIALHIMTAGHFNKRVDSIKFSFFRFLFAGFFSFIIFMIFEDLTWATLSLVWKPVLFSGIFGSCVAFTLMALSQRNLDNVSTSIIMSLESVFSLLSGWIILGQKLSGREILGSAILFTAVMAMQVYGGLKARKEKVND